MKNFITILLSIIMIFALAACSTGVATTTTGSSAGQSTNATASQTTDASTSSVAAANLSTSASAPVASLAEVQAENSQTHEAAGDDVYDPSTAVQITLNGDSITSQSANVIVEGSQATITAAGTYSLNGTLADGQIVVNTKAKETVQLVLNGVDIHSASSAPIYIADAEKVVIILADQTENTLSDSENEVFAVPADEEPSAAIFSKANLTFAGSGSLTVNGNFRDAINSKDGLIIAGGNITVNAVDDGIRGKDYLVVNNGSLTINVQGDGLKSDNAEDATLGYISIVAGSIQVTVGGDAINAQTDVLITGGEFTLTSGGGSSQRASESTSAKGIKGAVSVNIAGGTFTINAADDAVHSNGSVTIQNGAFNIASGDDGMHADQTLTVNGGEIQILQSYEGLESAVITLNGGSIHVTASDDGVNVAGGVDGSGMNPGGRPVPGGAGQDIFSYTGDYYLYIHGGYLFVDANGDGIDVNGAMEMTDGVVVVDGPTEQMNGALDHDAGFNMTGGFFVAAGSSGMAMTASESSSQPSTLIYLSAAQPAGTLVHIQNSAGEDILTFAPTKSYQSIAFSSPQLAQGATYTIYTGGSATGTAVDGLYQDAAYVLGAQAASFTTASTVTTVGTGGGRMGPGGGGPRR